MSQKLELFKHVMIVKRKYVVYIHNHRYYVRFPSQKQIVSSTFYLDLPEEYALSHLSSVLMYLSAIW
jgi:hypothetical protein